MGNKHLYLVMVLLVSLLAWGCAGDQAGSDATDAGDTEETATESTEAGSTESGTEADTYQPEPEPVMVDVTAPESTEVRVVLIDSIDTDIHTAGQEFRGVLAADVMADGRVLFDSGAAVMGVLDSVVESGRLKTPAELMFSLRLIEGAGGPVSVATYSIHEKKGGKTARDVALIGGGAIVGGIVGKITGKDGGTEIGAAAGAAAGAGAAAATGKDDIVHSAGTEAVFILKEPLTVSLPQ